MKIYTYEEIHTFAYQITNKKLKETKEILMRQDEYGISVAHCLAYNSNITKWSTSNKEVLMLQNRRGNSVAHKLADNHPTWKTEDIEILSLYSSQRKKSVEDILEEGGKI